MHVVIGETDCIVGNLSSACPHRTPSARSQVGRASARSTRSCICVSRVSGSQRAVATEPRAARRMLNGGEKMNPPEETEWTALTYSADLTAELQAALAALAD